MKNFSIILNSIVIIFSIYGFLTLGNLTVACTAFIFLGGIAVSVSRQKKSLVWVVLIGNLMLFIIGAMLAVALALGLLAPQGAQAVLWGSVVLLLYVLPSLLNLFFIKIRYFPPLRHEPNDAS
ncbi:hypothetical protein [Sessilibacter corallicola]|uniref:Phage holin family protein n=1 Tax=Sessilibacter corallicola TaxID=2904075 RepID=A0ABQ0AEC7_9GAMM